MQPLSSRGKREKGCNTELQRALAKGNGEDMRHKLSLLCEIQQTSILMSATYLSGDCHTWKVGKAQPVSSFINQAKFLEDFSSRGAQSTLEPNSKRSGLTDMAAKSAIASGSHH